MCPKCWCGNGVGVWLLAAGVCVQDIDKMRHAVGLKAYSSQQPLDEFRLEANRAFLVLLDSYRDAVVVRLMVPDLNFSLLLGQEQGSLEQQLFQQPGAPGSSEQQGQDGREAGQQVPAAGGNRPAVNGQNGRNGTSSIGRQDEGSDVLLPAGASKQRTP